MKADFAAASAGGVARLEPFDLRACLTNPILGKLLETHDRIGRPLAPEKRQQMVWELHPERLLRCGAVLFSSRALKNLYSASRLSLL